MPEKMPNTLMDMMSNTYSEKNPHAATSPAVIITGPIFRIESVTA